MKIPAHFYAFAIALVGLVGIIVLSAINHPVPNILSLVTVGALTAGAGISVPASPAP